MLKLQLCLQYLAPKRLLSSFVMKITRWQTPWWKNFLIRHFIKKFNIDLTEAVIESPNDYPHFNAFFTRELKTTARPLAKGENSLLVPADGFISALGSIDQSILIQAKQHTYTVDALLACTDHAFQTGVFTTIYLSPRNYHRVHMPYAGRLIKTTHVPGQLFSVAPLTVNHIPCLFARNERLICYFETNFGEMIIVLVGAMLVSGIETIWRGVEVPPYATTITTRDYQQHAIYLKAGMELGRFNMGSTVIVLAPAHVKLNHLLQPTQPVYMGENLGQITNV